MLVEQGRGWLSGGGVGRGKDWNIETKLPRFPPRPIDRSALINEIFNEFLQIKKHPELSSETLRMSLVSLCIAKLLEIYLLNTYIHALHNILYVQSTKELQVYLSYELR